LLEEFQLSSAPSGSNTIPDLKESNEILSLTSWGLSSPETTTKIMIKQRKLNMESLQAPILILLSLRSRESQKTMVSEVGGSKERELVENEQSTTMALRCYIALTCSV
jgi:hypothetical protein